MLSAITLLLQILILALLHANNTQSRPTSLIIGFIGLFSILYVSDLLRNKKTRSVAAPLVLGYLLRLFLVLIDVFGRSIIALPNSGADTEMFYKLAYEYAYGLSFRNPGAFPTLIGTLFSWIGTSRLYSQFLVMLFSVGALHMANRILISCEVPLNQRRRTMYVLSLLPNFAILSAILLRESIVTMFISIAIYFFVLWVKSAHDRWFLLAFTLAFCAAIFHSGASALAVGLIIIRLIYEKKRERFHLSFRNVLFAVLFLLVFVYLYSSNKTLFFAKMSSMNSIEDIANTGYRGGSSYVMYVANSKNFVGLFINAILRIVYFLFSPFPWQWRGVMDIFAFFFSSLFYLWALLRASIYLKREHANKKMRNLIILLLILAFCVSFVFAWGVSNTGTALRHREKMVIIFGMLWGLSHRQITTRKNANDN